MVAGIMASGNGTVNRESRLLTREENDQVCRMLGSRCESLASSVVQLFLTEPPDHGAWVKRDAGVLCVVKDHFKRSYFLRLYCLVRRGLVWEHEIYNSMEYNSPRTFLHTFEGQDCIVAFNFASEEDARIIQNVILQKLDRKQRRMERKSRSSYASSRHSSTPPQGPPQPAVVNKAPVTNGMSGPTNRQQYQPPQPNVNMTAQRGGRGGKRKFTKADIGLPRDFRHVSHVGWDPNKGFDLDNVEDPQLKHFFVKAGVSDIQLQDPETREFIYDFINQHGGLDAVKEDTTTHHPPPVPARVIPQPPPPHNHRQGSETRVAPPPPPSRGPPPVLPSTPPAAHHPPPPPPPSIRTLPSRTDTSQGPASGAPPPPPPPPPPAAPVLPPEPPTVRDNAAGSRVAAGGAPDPRNALMDAIRSGKPLKRVDQEAKRPSSGGDTRTDLLDQIRGGIELKSVQHVPKPPPDVVEENTLAGALARALAERSRVIHSDSDSSSDSEEDEEWED